jgi:hypothetical protein
VPPRNATNTPLEESLSATCGGMNPGTLVVNAPAAQSPTVAQPDQQPSMYGHIEKSVHTVLTLETDLMLLDGESPISHRKSTISTRKSILCEQSNDTFLCSPWPKVDGRS